MYSTNAKIILIIALIILFFVNYKFKVKDTFDNYTPTISMCIPCYPNDTKELNNLFESVRKLSIKPDEIIIGHSEMTQKQGQELEKKYSDLSVKVFTTEKKQYAAANRNMAAEHNNCDYISFMDADDEMTPNRFEILKNIIKKLKPKAILHSFYLNKKPKNIETNINEIVYGDKIFDILKKTKTPQITDYIVHHGHITVSKDTFKNIKQNTTEKYRRGQDSKYVRDISKFYGKKKNGIIFINIPLSVYKP